MVDVAADLYAAACLNNKTYCINSQTFIKRKCLAFLLGYPFTQRQISRGAHADSSEYPKFHLG